MSTVWPHEAPRISVIVRSFNRLGLLGDLIDALLKQDHDSFEIVVIEQSTDRDRHDVDRVDKLARDPRVRLLESRPLGGPGARNAGVRAARGDLLVFIDDDDLPASRDWLQRHEANFIDRRCLGVTGQFVGEGVSHGATNSICFGSSWSSAQALSTSSSVGMR